MKKNLKRTLLVALIASVTSSAYAAEIKTSTLGLDPNMASEKTGIQGWRPWMAAIGSNVVSGGQVNDEGKTIPTVGAVIEIPTYAKGSDLFKYMDKDGDLVASKGLGVTLPDGSNADTEFEVEWYIIDADDWATVTSWSDLKSEERIEAAAIQAGNNLKNKNSATLVVPETAAGKRIGFKARATSEYGTPQYGQQIQAWDLSKIWTQTEPTEPGECEAGDKECEDNGNGNGGDNNNGGGGTVIATDYQINVFDAKTNTPILPTSKLTVGQEFFATIRIKQVDDKGKETYRDPSSEELDTLKWNIVDVAGETLASYDKNSNRLAIASDKFSYAGLELTKYTFKTQSENIDAAEDLQKVRPFSEQSHGIQVVLTIADK